ncbi:hypothetical protein TEA_004853 [Camellia sinensis var. sinensis]|uniref:Glycosyltransferase N-terminal domain-containing protein n=1 Tax=Camellia sinensis var. sinensis TaxID=542762 RepID=A0A4S4ELF5_CAMSN|nr:hypothetical protein TEA_004853 [Camellia sinensis var. sinensis]
MGSIGGVNKPHAVCVPYPAQGHVNPMLKLAKLLHLRGFHITFVNTEYNHNRLLRSRGPNSLDGLPDFRFKTIPDGLPPWDADSTQDIPSLCDSTSKNCLVPFSNLISKLNHPSSSPDVPPVTCIVSDASMSFTLDAAEEFGVPEVLFWTPSASGVLGYSYYKHLVERDLVPLKALHPSIHLLPFIACHNKPAMAFLAKTLPNQEEDGKEGSEAMALLMWKARLDNGSQSLLSSWVGSNRCN